MNISLSQRRALVCGASQGIGRAIAISFAKAGAQVVALARSEAGLKSLLQDLPGSGHQALVCDLANRAQLNDQLKQELSLRGPITLIVNNAGGPKGGPLIEADGEEFSQALELHVLAAQKVLQLCLPAMKNEKYGRVLNVISTSVKIPIANLGVSNTIRGAMASWAKTMANELGPFGVTVNNLLPGFTKTERLNQLRAAAAHRLQSTEEQIEKSWLAQIPAGRFGEPEELASLATFLASPRASYINGVSIAVDGGRTGAL